MSADLEEGWPSETACDYCGTEVPDGAGIWLGDDRICERCCEEAQPTFRSAWEGLDLSRVGGWIVRHYRAYDSIIYGPFYSEREAFEFCLRWAPRGLTGMISPLISGEIGAEDLWDSPPWQRDIREDLDADLQRVYSPTGPIPFPKT